MRVPEQVFTHAVQDHLISRKNFQGLLITVKKLLNATHRVQFLCPFKKRKPEGLLKEKWNGVHLDSPAVKVTNAKGRILLFF